MKLKQQGFFRSVIVACVMFMLMSAIALSASAEGAMTISATNATVKQGKMVDVTLSLNGNVGIWGLRFRVGYDHDVFILKDVKNGTVFTPAEIIAPPSLDEKEYLFVADRSELFDTVANGHLVTLTFEVKDDSKLKEYPITVKLDDAIGVNGTDVEVSTADGVVTVEKSNQNSADEGKHPHTGDNTNRSLFVAALIASGGVLMTLRMIKKRKKANSKNK